MSNTSVFIEPYYELIIFDNDIQIISNSKHKKGKYLSQYLNIDGYLRVKLNNKNCNLHRLVALYFVDNPENKTCINHIDGNKLNNHPSNLEWCTIAENIKHSYDTGLHIAHRPESSGRYKHGKAIKGNVKEYKREWYLKNKKNGK